MVVDLTLVFAALAWVLAVYGIAVTLRANRVEQERNLLRQMLLDIATGRSTVRAGADGQVYIQRRLP